MSKAKITFPVEGAHEDELIKYIQQKREKDIDWRQGKSFALVYHPGDERAAMIKRFYDLYASENALNPTAFPSLPQLEAETISMCADLLRGDDAIRGNITSGGTESILLAVKTAKSWAKKNKPHIKKPNVVVPASVHPAFMKAFDYFNIDYTVVELTNDYRACPKAMREAVNENTILIVGSAPSYPHGLVDPIAEIAAIAKDKNILCHVDACVGGFILPFLRQLGHTFPNFDFSVDGVTSISADVHKYGYSTKGSSIILYKNAELRKCQFSTYTKWNGGVYGSPTMAGTRPAGSISGAWAALKIIGAKGYLDMAEVTMDITKKIRQAIEENPHLEIVGNPDMTILAFKSIDFDVFKLADELNKRGWHFERQQNPACLHLTINYIHRMAVDAFITDLNEAVQLAKKFGFQDVLNNVQVGMVKGLSKVLPSGTIARIQKSGKSPSEAKENTVAMYGMMGALSGTEDLEEIVLDFLDKVNALK